MIIGLAYIVSKNATHWIQMRLLESQEAQAWVARKLRTRVCVAVMVMAMIARAASWWIACHPCENL